MESVNEIVNFETISNKYACKLNILNEHEHAIREKLDVLRKDEEKNGVLLFRTYKELRKTKAERDVCERMVNIFDSLHEKLVGCEDFQ